MITGKHSQMQMSLYEEDQWCGSVRTPKFNSSETDFDHDNGRFIDHYNIPVIINWHNWYIKEYCLLSA